MEIYVYVCMYVCMYIYSTDVPASYFVALIDEKILVGARFHFPPCPLY